jgi:WD40 repeat protein
LSGHQSFVLHAAFSPDGRRVATASRDKTLRIWDVATGKQIAVLRGHHSELDSVAFSPDGARIVSASVDGTVRVWAARASSALITLDGREAAQAAFSADGTRVFTWDEGTAKVQDLATGKEIKTVKIDDQNGDHFVHFAGFSPDGSRFATASRDGTVKLWDTASGQQSAVLRHDNPIQFVNFSSDGTRVVTADDFGVKAWIWETATGRKIAELTIPNGNYPANFDWPQPMLSPDGTQVVAISGDNSVRVWGVATAKEIAVFSGHGGAVMSATFSPDGSRIVTASLDGTARIWDIESQKEVGVLHGDISDISPVLFAAFSQDGSRIVTGSEDYTARIWDVITGAEMAVLRGHDSWVDYAAFSPDGSRIVTTSNGTARIWDVHLLSMAPKKLIAHTCAWQLHGIGALHRDEMRLAGYPDTMPEIDVCADVE